MALLEQLKFAQGAIKKNNITPELEYYQIKDGRVVGYNGHMALSAPIDLDLEAKPKADLFYKALDACGETIAIDITPAGRLHIVSGSFSAYIACTEKEVYEASPQGDRYPAPAGLAAAFARMLPFISEDASRPWAMGLLVDHSCLTATNNIIIVQEWIGHALPTFNCPRFAVAEIARIGRDPTEVQVSETSVTFHYSDGSWLLTQRLATEWPAERMNAILDRPSEQTALPEGFFAAVAKIKPFVLEGHHSGVYFEEGAIRTASPGAQEGARIEIPGLIGGPIFNIKAISLLDGFVDTIDLTAYPAPCIFFGKQIRGAVLGMNL